MMTDTSNQVYTAGVSASIGGSVKPVVAVFKADMGNEGSSASREARGPGLVEQSSEAGEVQQGLGVDSAMGLQEMADALSRGFGERQSLKFSVDESTGVSVIKVTEVKTGEVVRQIPSEEALLLIKKIGQQKDIEGDVAVLLDRMA